MDLRSLQLDMKTQYYITDGKHLQKLTRLIFVISTMTLLPTHWRHAEVSIIRYSVSQKRPTTFFVNNFAKCLVDF